MTALTAPNPGLIPATAAARFIGSVFDIHNRRLLRSVSVQPIFNALIAVRPNSPIMERTIKNIKVWYSDRARQVGPNKQGLLGPDSMAKSVAEMVQEDCP